MSKEQLCAVNKKLLEHLKENEKYNAFYYEPVNNVYWKEKIKIAFCNLEPYSKNKYTANGFEKLVCVARFSNGEALYKRA